MTDSQNGWSVVTSSGTKWWVLPGSDVRLQLRRGSAGLVLAHLALWFDRNVERLDVGYDDWGWSPRQIAGSTDWSNHASATAVDLNSERHAYGRSGTFSPDMATRIRTRLDARYEGLLRWGGDYSGTKDEMHYEIVGTPTAVLDLSRLLEVTPVGESLLAVN